MERMCHDLQILIRPVHLHGKDPDPFAILPDCVHLVKGGLQRQTALHREDSLSPSLKRSKTLSIGKERQLPAEKRTETHAGDLPGFFQAIVQ